MTENVISLDRRRSSSKVLPRARDSRVRVKRHSKLGHQILFLLVFGAEFAFGMWMNSTGASFGTMP